MGEVGTPATAAAPAGEGEEMDEMVLLLLVVVAAAPEAAEEGVNFSPLSASMMACVGGFKCLSAVRVASTARDEPGKVAEGGL